jgi:bacterioferritin-associated ferredoxin
MILCICRNVSDRVVLRTIRDGASSIDEVQAACGAGGDCGACHHRIDQLVSAICGDDARQDSEVVAMYGPPYAEV